MLPSRCTAEISRAQRRVLQRKASEDQSERHARKYRLYDSGGRLYLRRHPEVVSSMKREREQTQERLDAWQARYEADEPVCSFAEHAWRVYNTPRPPTSYRSGAPAALGPADAEVCCVARCEAAENGAREDYDECLTLHFAQPRCMLLSASELPYAD